MYDLYPGQRAEGEVLLDGENILDPARRPQRLALARRHGVPEADALSDVDLRQHRLRHSALREALAHRPGRARRGALRGAALWDEVQGQAAHQRPRPLRRPAAAPVHRAHRRDSAGGHSVRRALLGARSDLDGEDRGADRRTVGALHDRHRHPQHAAGGARLRLHRLHVSRRARRIRRDERRVHRAAEQSARRTTSPAVSAERSEQGRRS